MPRLRVSLATCLLLLTLAAFAVALWVTIAEVQPLRQEADQLKQEVRRLQIQLGRFPRVGAAKIQVMQIDNELEDYWRLRIHLPIDRKYLLRTASGHMPVSQLPSPDWTKNRKIEHSKSSATIDSGEFTLDIRVTQSDGEWFLLIKQMDATGSRSRINLNRHADWLTDRRLWQITTPSHDAKIIDPKLPVVLFRLDRGNLKEFAGGHSVTPSQDLADGVIVWIEEKLPEATMQ